jgi:uncharacterized protein
MERYGDWMQTYSGKQFWPLDPKPDEIFMEDIAHALSLMCRYGGHSIMFYSVAEHCCHIHDYLDDEFKTWGLMHDASEAYIVDIPRPLKPFLAGYKDAERKVMDAVCDRFGMDHHEPPIVKNADTRILGDEQRQVMSAPPAPWYHTGDPLGVKIQFWAPERAESEFLDRAYARGLLK